MTDTLSTGLLAAYLPLLAVLAWLAPPQALLGLGLGLVFVPGEWELGGFRVDPTDLLCIAIGLVIILRGTGNKRIRIPYLGLWFAYVVLMSLSYLYAPDNQTYLGDPVRDVFQLFRYCWKLVLFYPFAAVLVRDNKTLQPLLLTLVLTADACAIQGTLQANNGLEPLGPFGQKNELAAFLVIPIFITLANFLTERARWSRITFGLSVLILVRGLVSAGSRGAFVACLAGVGILVAGLMTTSRGRANVKRWATIALVLLPVGLALKPDILERPNIQYLLTASDPASVDTYQWRQEERWPFFFQKMVNNPWLGVGTDVDYSLGESCATPHNGYLAVGVRYGIPALLILVTMVLLGVRNGYRLFRRSPGQPSSLFGLVVTASFIALLVHNYVDATILTAGVSKVFWLMAAVAAIAIRYPKTFAVPQPRRVPQAPAPAPAPAPGTAAAPARP